MPEALSKLCIDLNTKFDGYYAFVHRVCKEYKGYIESDVMQDELFSHRDTIASASIADVFTQVRPLNQLPFQGDSRAALVELLPVLEIVFKMPPAGHPTGSIEWVKLQCKKPQNISFAAAARFDDLRKALVRFWIKTGDPRNGFPVRADGKSLLAFLLLTTITILLLTTITILLLTTMSISLLTTITILLLTTISISLLTTISISLLTLV